MIVKRIVLLICLGSFGSPERFGKWRGQNRVLVMRMCTDSTLTLNSAVVVLNPDDDAALVVNATPPLFVGRCTMLERRQSWHYQHKSNAIFRGSDYHIYTIISMKNKLMKTFIKSCVKTIDVIAPN